MNSTQKYGRDFNPEVMKDLKDLNEKIEKEQDPEELLRLRMQRMMRGLEINSGLSMRPFGAYFPY